MGKYGIGARVRDEDGDEGVIVGRRKGERLVQYGGDLLGLEVWVSKSYITPIAANDDATSPVVQEQGGYKVGDRVRLIYGTGPGRPVGSVGTVVSIWSSEKGGTVQFDAPFSGWGDCGRCWNVSWDFLAALEWQPKVGDRVRIARSGWPFKDGHIGREFVIHGHCGDLDGEDSWSGAEGSPSKPWRWKTSELEFVEPLPIAAEAQPAELRIQPGKHYRRKFQPGNRVGMAPDDRNPGTVIGYRGDEVEVRWDRHDPVYRETYGEQELFRIIPAKSFIVCKLTERGQPQPNKRPRVHHSFAAADREATRLVAAHRSVFGVYERVSVCA